MTETVTCKNPVCGADIGFWEHVCAVCGTPHSYPNVRKAEHERDTLMQFYRNAQSAARNAGMEPKVVILENVVADGKIVINTDINFLYNLINDPKMNFSNYHRLTDAQVRKAALEQHHIDRRVADDALFPNYLEHIVQGALSCDGQGLPNYGPVGVFLKNTVAQLRVSLLIDNSFGFLKRHFQFQKPLPTGYRAVWDDRSRLAVVKHQPELTSSMSESEIRKLIVRPGPDRYSDDFIEVHIYDGFDKRAIESVILSRLLARRSDRNRWQDLKELLTAEGIDFEEGGAKS